ncbi:MAG: helix-turn-helix domain-containing protein, partial [Paraglaciecola sp.]|nr:helix-turn-helix domain-containing protein [Paraglaciecola sp.]
DQWHKAVLTRTEMLNRQIKKPLVYAEYKHIAKSIAKFTHANFSKQGFAEWQAVQGKKGGIAKGKSFDEVRQKAIQLHSDGLSKQAIAEQLGIHRNTVRNYVMHK